MKKINIKEISEQMAIDGYNPYAYKKGGIGRLGKKALEAFTFYFDILANLSQIAYKWKNVPLEIPDYQIERCLFYYGIVGFSKDDVADAYVCLPCVIDSSKGLNKYGEGKGYKLYSVETLYNYPFENNVNGVVGFNNALKKPNSYLAYRYAERLQLIDDIIDINIGQQRKPYILLSSEKTKKSLETFFTKLKLGEEVIYPTQDLDLENVIKVLDTKVELKANELIEAKREIFNEACMYMGITANLSNKKERLISSEVKSEERRHDIFREIGLRPRKYFCDKVNKLYNIDLSVDYVLEEEELKAFENMVVNKNSKKDKKEKN